MLSLASAVLAGCDPYKKWTFVVCSELPYAIAAATEPVGGEVDFVRVPPRGEGNWFFDLDVAGDDAREAQRGPWLPEGIGGLILRDSAGHTLRITRAELFRNPQWYNHVERAWWLRVVPDGEHFRVSHAPCPVKRDAAR
jgi:hypothetical protein